MNTFSVPILAKKYSSTVLLFLLERGAVRKNDIVSVVPSNTTVDKLVLSLSKHGLVSVESGFRGRKLYSISLTKKGISVAEQLRKADAAARAEGGVLVEPRKLCMNCSTSNENDAKFCKGCGMKLRSE